MKRRTLLELAALLALPGSTLAQTVGATQAAATSTLLLSAVSDPDDHHWIVGARATDAAASIAFREALPGRGHHVAVNRQHGCYVVVARRPGTWLLLGDLATGAVLAQLQVPAGRHLYGHGVFSADERFFYTTESAFEDRDSDSGLVVEWTLTEVDGGLTLQRGREFPTQGVGPHELLLMPDGETLVVANGGMRTHPATEREVLNLDSMQPSLVYLDRRSGAVLEQQFLPAELHQNSVRHLDVNAAGQVAIGLQFQGEPWQAVPLVATHRRGEALRWLAAPPELQPAMQQYVGSVRFSGDGSCIAASCPRGNLLTFWNAADGTLLRSLRARDACGVAAVAQGFVFSSGVGRLAAFDPVTDTVTDFALPQDWRGFWDNHLNAAATPS